jgi:predicted Zn-dependent protease
LNGIRNIKYHTNFIERNDAVMYIESWNPTTVNVNCKSALDYSDKEVLAIMAHEMQHVLENYYPLTQDETLQRDFNATKNESGDYSSNSLNKKNINNSYELMKKEGFDIHGLDFYLHEIDSLDKNKQTGYFQNPSEIRSIITGIRNELGKTQGNDITIDEIKKLVASKSEGNVVHLMGVAMMSGKSMTDTLKSINSYALNDTNPNQEKTA